MLLDAPVVLLAQKLLFSYCEWRAMGENTAAHDYLSEQWSLIPPALAAALHAYAACGSGEQPARRNWRAWLPCYWICRKLPDVRTDESPTDGSYKWIAPEHAVSWQTVADTSSTLVHGSQNRPQAGAIVQSRTWAVFATRRFLSLETALDASKGTGSTGTKVNRTRFSHSVDDIADGKRCSRSCQV